MDRASVSSGSSSRCFSEVHLSVTPDIQELVLKALSPSESIPAKLLAKKLRLPKKIVNKALYSLERLQKASKEGLLPPEWTLYRETLGDQGNQNSKPRSSHSQRTTQKLKAELELKAGTEQAHKQPQEEDSDIECSSSSSSFESSDSDQEESQSPAKPQHEANQQPITTSPTSQELQPPTMAEGKEQKELVMKYLLKAGEATALVIAKNLGLKSTKQINPTLYALEKQGEVTKNSDVTPIIWELSKHRRDRMERSLKASKGPSAESMKTEDGTGGEGTGGSAFLPSAPPAGFEPISLQEGLKPRGGLSEVVGGLINFNAGYSGGVEGDVQARAAGKFTGNVLNLGDPLPGLEPIPDQGMPGLELVTDPTHPSISVITSSIPFPSPPPSLSPLHPSSRCQEDETNGGQWATDDIPEFLNAIRRETDAEKAAGDVAMGTVAVSLAAPPPQNLWAKLQEVKLKNPVSGLMEYAQYLGQSCEFQLLDQSGPSHDPRSVTPYVCFG